MTQIGRGNFFQGSQSQFVSNNNFWSNGATHGGAQFIPYVQPGFCGTGCYEPSVANTAINNGTVIALGVLGLILLRGLSRGGGHGGGGGGLLAANNGSGIPSNSVHFGKRNKNITVNTRPGEEIHFSADKKNKKINVNA